jgi:hypothetical protein
MNVASAAGIVSIVTPIHVCPLAEGLDDPDYMYRPEHRKDDKKRNPKTEG